MSSDQSPYGAVLVIALTQLAFPCSLDVDSTSRISVILPF